MNKYSEEQKRIYRQGKLNILKFKIIGAILALAVGAIGILILFKGGKYAIAGLFITAIAEGPVINIFKKKIRNERYTMNFKIEELEKLKIQDKMNY